MRKQLMSIISIVSIIGLLFFSACQNKNIETTENLLAEGDSIASENQIADEEIQQTANEEIREYRKILHIEDGEYPMFVVTIEFPERKMKSDFNLNIEAISLDHNSLIDLTGKYVTFYYVCEMENMLMDIRSNGKSLLGEYAPETDPEWKKITGILSGAESESMGDLPDEILVTNNSAEHLSFKEYITEEMVSVNGKEVTVYYNVRGVETITRIEPAEK